MQVTGVSAQTSFTFQRRGRIDHGAVSQAARSLNSIGTLNLNPNVYSRFLSLLARRCEVFAGRLAELGLPKDVTPDLLVKRYGSVFTPKGLTRRCASRISRECRRVGLNPEETMLFRFLKNEGVKKPSIFGVLHYAEGTPVVEKTKFKPEAPLAEKLAKISENWRSVEQNVRAFFAERGQKVDW